TLFHLILSSSDYYLLISSPSFFFSMLPPPPRSTLFPYTTLFRSHEQALFQTRIPAAFQVEQFITDHVTMRQIQPKLVARDEFRRSEEHTSELQSRGHLVCRLLLEKKKKKKNQSMMSEQMDMMIEH